MAMGIKRGATLLLGIQFTDDEWARIAPITQARTFLRIGGGEKREIATTVHADLKAITMRAETAGWPTGRGEWDTIILNEGRTIILPELSNVDLPVLEGVSA